MSEKGTIDPQLGIVAVAQPNTELQSVRVDRQKYPYEKKSQSRELKKNSYVFQNAAYVGSLNSINERPPPPTSVVREQYWACTRWPGAQKILAAAVGILVGAVIGLAVSMVLSRKPGELIPGVSGLL